MKSYVKLYVTGHSTNLSLSLVQTFGGLLKIQMAKIHGYKLYKYSLHYINERNFVDLNHPDVWSSLGDLLQQVHKTRAFISYACSARK